MNCCDAINIKFHSAERTVTHMNYKLLPGLVALVNATELLTGIMEPDSAWYAFIAKQMVQQNDFINLYNSIDWLDKPHFPFE